MPLFVVLAIAAVLEAQPTLRPPVPRSSPATWFNEGDFPVKERANLNYAGVGVRLEIGADGKIIRCLTKSGNANSAAFEKLTCDIISKRGQFTPAADRQGNPVMGVYKTLVFWMISDGQGHAKSPAELTFAMAALPDGVRSSDRTAVNLLVGADGIAQDCSVDPPLPSKDKRENEHNEAMKTLGEMACKAAVGVWKTEAVQDQDGKPGPSVQAAAVEFVLAKPQPR